MAIDVSSRGMTHRLMVIFILGFSSGLPMALVGSTLQAWFATSGLSIMATGMLTLISIPYVYRTLWAPIVDKFSLSSLGRRRSWIMTMHVLLMLGFNALAWCAPIADPLIMTCLAFFVACVSATDDIAIDAQRTEYLPLSEQALGASIASFGYRLSLLTSGGLALIMAHFIGFAWTYRFMGLLLLPGCCATLWSTEPPAPKSSRGFFLEPFKELLSRPDIRSFFAFIFFYKLGEAFTASTSGVMMPFLIQGLGFPLHTIGFVQNILGVCAIILGGLFSGIVLMRYPLYPALIGFGLFQALTNVLFIGLAYAGPQLPLFAIAVISDNLATGMGTTALVALFMRSVDRRFTATQFSLLVSIAALPRILASPFAAMLQTHIGWTGIFQFAFIATFGFIPFLGSVKRSLQHGELCAS